MSAAGRQAGVALLTVLLIVFLASLTATSLAALQQFAIRRHTLLQHQQQARLYALGAEQWAAAILERDKDKARDHLGEEWAAGSLSRPVEGGFVSGRIQDLQGCFNLNNLLQSNLPNAAEGDGRSRAAVDSKWLGALQRLLAILELDPGIAQAIADWIDPDQEPLFPDGAEDSEYTQRSPPYITANRPLLSVSELRSIKGIDPESYAKLAPYVCALPPGTPVNVNTASPLVLAALDGQLDPNRLGTLIEERPAQGYRSLEEFLEAAQLNPNASLRQQLDLKSRYFLVSIEAQVGEARARLSSLLERGDQGNSRILLRSFGNDY